jgi:hypothetical protein
VKKSSVIKYELGNSEISFSPDSNTFSLPRGELSPDQLEQLIQLAVEVLNDVTGSDFSSLTSNIVKSAPKSTVPVQFAASPPGMDLDLWANQ